MNAVIIYDEFRLAANSKAFLDRAAHRAHEVFLWQVKPWRIDMLIHPVTAYEVFTDAAKAQLIVFAIRSRADLAPWLLEWLETWAVSRQFQDATLAVFDGANGDSLSTTATPGLTRFAERHGLSFIFGDVAPEEIEPAAFGHDLHACAVA